jgi:hypothetical protein
MGHAFLHHKKMEDVKFYKHVFRRSRHSHEDDHEQSWPTMKAMLAMGDEDGYERFVERMAMRSRMRRWLMWRSPRGRMARIEFIRWIKRHPVDVDQCMGCHRERVLDHLFCRCDLNAPD